MHACGAVRSSTASVAAAAARGFIRRGASSSSSARFTAAASSCSSSSSSFPSSSDRDGAVRAPPRRRIGVGGNPSAASPTTIDARRHSSSSSSSAPSASADSTTAKTEKTPRPPVMYMWGTSKKGTIPLPEIIDEAQSGQDAATSLLNRGGTVIDHPRLVDPTKAFGIDGKEVYVKHVECGASGTAVLLSDGRCFTFGENTSGQLGHGHKNDVLVPAELKVPDSSPLSQTGVEMIRLGPTFSAIIDKNGDLYTFGFGGSTFAGLGCLGHGNAESYTEPKLVESLVEDGCYAKEVLVGESHMTVMTTEGEVLTTGAGSYGRLGNLETTDQLFLEPVELLGADDVVQIAGGFAFTLALTRDGIIEGWGRNDKGQLGTGMGLAVDMYAMESLPRPIESQLEGRRVAKVAAGHSHAACVTDGGELFMWGSSVHLEPELMTTVLHTKIVDIACGQNYTIALAEDGKIYSFGKGKTGVLGLANTKKLSHPALVEGLADKKVLSMSAGWTHFGCLVEDTGEEEETAESEK